MSLADRLLSRLDGVRRVGHNGWIARCPAHEDRSPSLCITESDGKVLVYCHAECPTAEILGVVGLRMSDLFEPRPDRYEGRQRRAYFNARAVLACMAEDSLLIFLAGQHIVEGKPLSARDMEALKNAVVRVRNGARLGGSI